jgi:hypothetical protein
MAEGGVITLEEGKLETVLCITRYPYRLGLCIKKKLG